MKTISLWQPWATLMAEGFKKNETRHWGTAYRGPLIIHAAKRIEPPTILMRALLAPLGYRTWEDFPRGALLCKVILCGCFPTDTFRVEHPEYQFGDYSSGRYVWVTEKLEKLENPIPYKGHQGFFDVDIEQVEKNGGFNSY